MGVLSGQPPDVDEMFDRLEFPIVSEHGPVDTLGCCHAEGIRIRDSMRTFDLGRCSHQRVIHRHQFDRQLFQQPQGFVPLAAPTRRLTM